MDLFPSDWSHVFLPQAALFEILMRGTALYCGVLVLMRLMPRRSGGELAAMDLVFVLLIAEAVAEGMGGHTSVADGLLLVVVFMAWNYLINLLSYRVPFLERLISAQPLPIVRDGKLLRRNMRREFLTEQELMAHLRMEGMEDIGEVKSAHVEADGKITVVRRKAARS